MIAWRFLHAMAASLHRSRPCSPGTPTTGPTTRLPVATRRALGLVLATAVLSLGLGATACEARENPYEVEYKQGPNLHEIDNTATEEELAAARKAAGHPTQDEIAAENAKMFEKGAREYIKTRLSEYRDFVAEFRKLLGDVESRAPKWSDEGKFAKFADKHRKAVKSFADRYDELTGKGAEGGETQADLGYAFRTFENLNEDLGPGVADNEAFAATLGEIRERLDKVEAALEDIAGDDSLEIDPLYKPKKRGRG